MLLWFSLWGEQVAGVIREAAVLRRDLRAKLEGGPGVGERILAAPGGARPGAAESKAGRDKSEENAGLRRGNAGLKAPLKQGGASDSEIRCRQRCVQLQKCARLEGEPAGARAPHRRVSNVHAPPKGGDAQRSLAKCRKRNKANYHSEERKESRQSGGPGKKPLPATKNANLTVEECPERDVDAKAKIETGDAADIPRVPEAEKTQYRICKGRCGSGHGIDSTPRGLARGSAFGQNLTTQIAFPFFTAPGPSPMAKALQAYGPGGGCGAEVCRGGGPHPAEAGRLQVPDGGRDADQNREGAGLRAGLRRGVRHQVRGCGIRRRSGAGPAPPSLPRPDCG